MSMSKSIYGDKCIAERSGTSRIYLFCLKLFWSRGDDVTCCNRIADVSRTQFYMVIYGTWTRCRPRTGRQVLDGCGVTVLLLDSSYIVICAVLTSFERELVTDYVSYRTER